MSKKLVLLIVLGFSLPIFWQSCQKDTECKLVVNVVDTLSKPLSGVIVNVGNNHLSSSKPSLSLSQTTDKSGSTTFAYKLPAIYDVNLTYTIPHTTITKTDSGVGSVHLMEGQTINATFTFR